MLLLAIVGWLILLPTWMAVVSLREVSPWLLLGIISAVVIADSAAYFAGKRFGKHKLAPLISPGKTWEGVAGAWIAVSIYGFALCQILGIDYWLIIGLWGITVLSIMGDLLESLVKRHAGVKDSGNLLPGHGGMLDRVDGLTSSLPLATFFVYFPLYYAAWIRHV
jgi:phosphatidate cytidylyltransferase